MIDAVIYPSVCSAFYSLFSIARFALHVQQHMESVFTFSFFYLKVSFRIFGLGGWSNCLSTQIAHGRFPGCLRVLEIS